MGLWERVSGGEWLHFLESGQPEDQFFLRHGLCVEKALNVVHTGSLDNIPNLRRLYAFRHDGHAVDPGHVDDGL